MNHWISNLKTEQLKRLKNIIIKMEIGVLDIFDANGRAMDLHKFENIFYAKPDMLSLETFVWKIDKETVQNIKAATNGFIDLHICLMALPSNIMNCVYWILMGL